MAGTVKASVLQHDVTGIAPVIKDGAGTEIGQFTKMWLNYNGTSPATRSSFNVSSVTKNTTGDYSASFTTSLSDGNYSSVATGEWTSGVTNVTVGTSSSLNTSSVARIKYTNMSSAGNDTPYAFITVIR